MGRPGCIWGPTDGGGGGARRGGNPARTMVEDDTAGLQGQGRATGSQDRGGDAVLEDWADTRGRENIGCAGGKEEPSGAKGVEG